MRGNKTEDILFELAKRASMAVLLMCSEAGDGKGRELAHKKVQVSAKISRNWVL